MGNDTERDKLIKEYCQNLTDYYLQPSNPELPHMRRRARIEKLLSMTADAIVSEALERFPKT